jgi:hypothetical protein
MADKLRPGTCEMPSAPLFDLQTPMKPTAVAEIPISNNLYFSSYMSTAPNKEHVVNRYVSNVEFEHGYVMVSVRQIES